ncbi:hypothetical protein [Arenibacter algicola]|uniref:hypothetical protein n=1 Tax=Arenibacter algicola TaxID=616991 RepID=UPI0004DF4CA9|nr:hypothetical protein [Arenibacter algicola]|tara:strand:- start:12050 stop:12469 length:420 start_codon:yes stop_codon:yes gene_type:complete
MIKEYKTKEKGYHPFIIEDGWQLAKLNYTEDQHIDKINQLDVHLETDEVFVAIAGKSVLIAAIIINNEPHFELEPMKINQIYNIPKGVWHNIAMEKGSEVLIAEKSNTHVADFEHFALSNSKKKELETLVKGHLESLKI